MIDSTFKDTITLYNHYTVNDGKTAHKWGRIVLHNCYFGKVTADNSNNLSTIDADTFVCRIPQSPTFTFLYQGGADTFSLAEGDIIVNGAVMDEISDEKDRRPSDILRKYKGNAFEVKSVSINTYIPFAQHYRALGV